MNLASPETPSPEPMDIPAPLRWTQSLAVGCLVGLVVLCLGWELWWAPIRPGGSWLALKALPLCIPLAGLLKRRLYTYRWVSLMVWLYFTEGVVRGYSDPMPSQALAWIEIALCLGPLEQPVALEPTTTDRDPSLVCVVCTRAEVRVRIDERRQTLHLILA